MHETAGRSENSQRRYETRDVTGRPMVWAALGLIILTIAGLVASWLAFTYFVEVQKLGPPASPFENARELPPPPRLQVKPAEDLKGYKNEVDTQLNNYGWVDKNAGVVRIPIERAMELSLERGFPTRANKSSDRGKSELAAGVVPPANPGGKAASATQK